jgi:hypothetical protein
MFSDQSREEFEVKKRKKLGKTEIFEKYTTYC